VNEHALASLQDRDLRTGASGDVRELRGDVTAADQTIRCGRRSRFKKSSLVAKYSSRNTELDGLRPAAIRK